MWQTEAGFAESFLPLPERTPPEPGQSRSHSLTAEPAHFGLGVLNQAASGFDAKTVNPSAAPK
ncbi:hypothetical protein H4S00_007013, partial [Coemansia sp. D1744]